MSSVQISGVGFDGCHAVRGTAGTYGQGAGITGQGDAGTEARKCFRLGSLQVGAMAGLGITLPQLLKLEAAAINMPGVETYKPIASSVIHIFLPGGMARNAQRFH